MSLPNITITSPSGLATHIDFTASHRYRSPVHRPSHRLPPKTPLQSRKPASLRLDLFPLLFHPLRSSPVYLPLSKVDLTRFHGGCSCPASPSGFCHVCLLTAQEMATELASYQPKTAGRRRCKCNRGLGRGFCDACYTDFDGWMRRLRGAVGRVKEEEKGRGVRWQRAVDRRLHLWEAHGEAIEWTGRVGRQYKMEETQSAASAEEAEADELWCLVNKCEEWFRLSHAAHQPRGGGVPSTNSTPEVRDTKLKVLEKQEINTGPHRGQYGQRLNSQWWNDLEVVGSMEEGGISPFDAIEWDENKARAEPEPSRDTGTTRTREAEKKKRAKTKTKGKWAKIFEKVKRCCSWKKL